MIFLVRSAFQPIIESSHFQNIFINLQILQHILGYLPLEDKKNARVVSKRWNGVLDSFFQFNIPLTNTSLRSFESRNCRINELKVVLNQLNIPERFSPMLQRSFQTTKTLYFMADDYVEYRYRKIDGKGIERFLKTCSQIETLKFNFSFMANYLMTSALDVRKVKLPFLTKLQVKHEYFVLS